MNSDCPQHYALNASGKEAINLGSMSASLNLHSVSASLPTADIPWRSLVSERLLAASVPSVLSFDSYGGFWSPTGF